MGALLSAFVGVLCWILSHFDNFREEDVVEEVRRRPLCDFAFLRCPCPNPHKENVITPKSTSSCPISHTLLSTRPFVQAHKQVEEELRKPCVVSTR